MNLEELRDRLAELSPRLYPLFSSEFGDAVLGVDRSQFMEAVTELKAVGFNRLGMITAVDYRDWVVVVYRFKSQSLSAAIFVKVQLANDDLVIPSLCGLWEAANWQEREVYDLLGVTFEGHPDLRRILLPPEFEGHPLRKDYDDPRLIRRPDYI